MPFREVLVTGASSAIGRALAAHIRADYPAARITGVSRRPAAGVFDRWVEADLAGTIPPIDGEFDLVVHTAAAVPATVRSEDEFEAVNVQGAAALLRTIVTAPRCGILNLSSSAVYDAPTAADIDESAAKTTTNPYGRSKLAFEQVLGSQLLRPGMTALTLRVPVLLVSGVANNFIAGWIKALRSAEPLTLFNPDGLLNAVVDADAIYRFMQRHLTNGGGGHVVCNVSSREPLPIRAAAAVVMEAMSTTVAVVERTAAKPAQTINHALARHHGYEPPTVAECLTRFASEARAEVRA